MKEGLKRPLHENEIQTRAGNGRLSASCRHFLCDASVCTQKCEIFVVCHHVRKKRARAKKMTHADEHTQMHVDGRACAHTQASKMSGPVRCQEFGCALNTNTQYPHLGDLAQAPLRKHLFDYHVAALCCRVSKVAGKGQGQRKRKIQMLPL